MAQQNTASVETLKANPGGACVSGVALQTPCAMFPEIR